MHSCGNCVCECNVHGSVHRKNIPIYDVCTRCNVTQFIISGNCSTCFGWYLHPSSGAQTPVSTASGICQTDTATCHYSTHHQERKHLYLQHLVFVRPLLLSAAIAAGSSNGLTLQNTRLPPWGDVTRWSCKISSTFR